ncbi:MAG TPA: carboxypeptidase regulatory-like domain-containing protein [Myxococcota bacterium]|nr:carboxypeptidase regulatory-like domain-containing protein [Myxococcota bacterium]
MNRIVSWHFAWWFLAAGLSAPGALATTFSGTVATTGGQPIAGAMVTAFDEPKSRKETVFTGSDGRYTLHTSFVGNLTLRARTPYFKDVVKTVTATDTDVQIIDFAAEKLVSPAELSDSLPASAHAAILPFPSKSVKDTFISQCNYCHQQGNSLTRRPRPEDEWKQTVRRMEGYAAMVTYSEARAISKTMLNALTARR